MNLYDNNYDRITLALVIVSVFGNLAIAFSTGEQVWAWAASGWLYALTEQHFKCVWRRFAHDWRDIATEKP